MFLLTCGVDALGSGSLLGVADRADDLAGFLAAELFAEEVVGVDGDEEVTEVIGDLFTVRTLAVESLTVVAVLKNSGKKLGL